MQWKRFFSDVILQRGRLYFEQNRVMHFKKNAGGCSADVYGNGRYSVKISIQNDRVNSMKCTCPDARNRRNCKHMAAVFYYMEAEEKQRETAIQMELETIELPPEIVELESGKEGISTGQGYSYFDCMEMKKAFFWNENDLKKAYRYVHNKHISLRAFRETYDAHEIYYYVSSDDSEMFGVAEGEFYDSGLGAYPVRLVMNGNKIIQAQCRVPNCGCTYTPNYWYNELTMCEHQLALFMLVKQYLKANSLGDATDKKTAHFLKSFYQRKAMQAKAESVTSPDQLTFTPRLTIESDRWTAGFKIGQNKFYVVKNMTELVGQIQRGDVVRFGATAEWDVSLDRFSEQGKRIYGFISKMVAEERLRQTTSTRWGNDEGMELRDEIPLYGHRIDEFMQIVGNESIEITVREESSKKKKMGTFREKRIPISIQVKPYENGGIFHGVRVTGELPEYTKGNTYVYFYEDGYVNYSPKDDLQEIEPLLNDQNEIEMQFGRRELGAFYHKVLPWLKQYAEVKEIEGEKIAEYLPPEAAFEFYLDIEDASVLCRAEAVYGDIRLNMVHELNYKRTLENFRDLLREEEVYSLLHRLFGRVDDEQEVFWHDEEDKAYEILNGGVEQLQALGEVHVTDRFSRKRARRRPQLSVGLKVESQLLDLSISSDDISQQELLDILQSYRAKKRYHRLKNGDFVSLEDESLEVLSQMMEALHLSPKDITKGKMQIPVYRALYLDKMLEQCEDVYVQRDRVFKTLVKDFKTIKDSEYEVPTSLAKTLRNYQEEGYRWLQTLSAYGLGGILADDMGLGKTLQVIALLLANQGKGKALIITPASLVYNWGEEFKRFAPELKVSLITGTQTERQEKLQSCGDMDVLVTSYDLLKRDIKEYEDMSFEYEVIDEAQYIKNQSTAAAKAVKVIRSRIHLALTGTPIENRLSELWSIFDYLIPGYLYSYEAFRKELEQPIVKNKKEEVAERLRKMVAPFILRRLKSDVLKDLPDKLEEARYVQLEKTQRNLYEGQVVHMKQMVEQTSDADFERNKLQILAELTRIRQICCDPKLCFEEYAGESAKREACIEMIQNAVDGEHKVLLFSQFTSMLELLETDLQKVGIQYYKITGSTSKEERMRLVQAFNVDDTRVFLISLKAGGTGLNLTGADIVIHYDPWWNVAAQNQATDRAHRIGQTKVVTVYQLIVKDSIEEKILKMQQDKKNLADKILSGETGQLGSMSKEELMELLSV